MYIFIFFENYAISSWKLIQELPRIRATRVSITLSYTEIHKCNKLCTLLFNQPNYYFIFVRTIIRLEAILIFMRVFKSFLSIPGGDNQHKVTAEFWDPIKTILDSEFFLLLDKQQLHWNKTFEIVIEQRRIIKILCY